MDVWRLLRDGIGILMIVLGLTWAVFSVLLVIVERLKRWGI